MPLIINTPPQIYSVRDTQNFQQTKFEIQIKLPSDFRYEFGPQFNISSQGKNALMIFFRRIPQEPGIDMSNFPNAADYPFDVELTQVTHSHPKATPFDYSLNGIRIYPFHDAHFPTSVNSDVDLLFDINQKLPSSQFEFDLNHLKDGEVETKSLDESTDVIPASNDQMLFDHISFAELLMPKKAGTGLVRRVGS